MAASSHQVILKQKIKFLDTTEFLDTHVWIDNPHWQNSRIIIFLCKYDIVILDKLLGSFLDVFFFLLTVILSELHEKPRLSYGKKTWKKLCEGHYFFDCTNSFLCHFLLLFLSSPFPYPLDVFAEWPLKRCIILRCLVYCVMIPWVNGRKYDKSLQFSTSCFAYLGTWFFLRLCFNFTCLAMALHQLKRATY